MCSHGKPFFVFLFACNNTIPTFGNTELYIILTNVPHNGIGNDLTMISQRTLNTTKAGYNFARTTGLPQHSQG